MHCKPKHNPRAGIFISRAYLRAPTFPSMPRTPNPPGTQIASRFLSSASAPDGGSQSSLAIQTISTFALLAKPPALNASVTER